MIPSENPIASQPRFPTWRTVRRGVYKTLGAYLAAMELKKYFIGIMPNEMLRMVIWAQEEAEEEIVRVLDEDLGLADPYTLDELLAADVAAGVREQYDDQPIDEWCLAAMNPLTAFNQPGVFSIGRNGGGVRLMSYWISDSVAKYALGNVWILSRRKPASAT